MTDAELLAARRELHAQGVCADDLTDAEVEAFQPLPVWFWNTQSTVGKMRPLDRPTFLLSYKPPRKYLTEGPPDPFQNATENALFEVRERFENSERIPVILAPRGCAKILWMYDGFTPSYVFWHAAPCPFCDTGRLLTDDRGWRCGASQSRGCGFRRFDREFGRSPHVAPHLLPHTETPR